MTYDRLTDYDARDDDMPHPHQMQRLAICSLSVARKKESLRIIRKAPCKYWSRLMLDSENEALDPEVLDVPLQRRRIVGVNVARQALATDAWSMQLFDTDYFGDGDSRRYRRMQSIYSFEWQHSAVTKAERTLSFIKKPHLRPLEHGLSTFMIPDDIATTLEMEEDIACMTSGDCERLIEDIEQYYSQSDQLRRVRS